MGANRYFRVGFALLTSAVALSGCGVANSDTSDAAVEQALEAPCNVRYTLNTYIGNDGKPGFTADIGIKNYGAPISGWTLNWTFLSGEQIVYKYNANVVQNLANVTATDVVYNKNIGTGQSVNFGVIGTSTTTAVTPTSFTLNGQACSIN